MGMHLLLSDTRSVYRHGLRNLFSHESDVTSISEAVSYEDLKCKVATLSFDLILVHHSLVVDMAVLPRGRFVLFVTEPQMDMLLAAHDHGARGYFTEDPPINLSFSLPSI